MIYLAYRAFLLGDDLKCDLSLTYIILRLFSITVGFSQRHIRLTIKDFSPSIAG